METAHKSVITMAKRTLLTLHFLLKSELLRTHYKLTLHKVLIRSVMTYDCPAWEIRGRHSFNEIVTTAKQGSPHHC
jgi:hypothetical protein